MAAGCLREVGARFWRGAFAPAVGPKTVEPDPAGCAAARERCTRRLGRVCPPGATQRGVPEPAIWLRRTQPTLGQSKRFEYTIAFWTRYGWLSFGVVHAGFADQFQ